MNEANNKTYQILKDCCYETINLFFNFDKSKLLEISEIKDNEDFVNFFFGKPNNIDDCIVLKTIEDYMYKNQRKVNQLRNEVVEYANRLTKEE